MMSRAAMLLGTAALASASAADHPLNKWTVSAVNFTMSVAHSTTAFDGAAQAEFVTTVVDRVAGKGSTYGIEIWNLEAHKSKLSHSMFNARFYGAANANVADVEKIAYEFYRISNEQVFDDFEVAQQKQWVIANDAAKAEVLVSREKHEPAVATPVPAVTPVPQVDATAMHVLYPNFIFAEVDCKHTNYTHERLPDWAKEVTFKAENFHFHAQCHDDDDLSAMTIVGLVCGACVGLGFFVFAFILLCSGGNQGKPAPAGEPVVA